MTNDVVTNGAQDYSCLRSRVTCSRLVAASNVWRVKIRFIYLNSSVNSKPRRRWKNNIKMDIQEIESVRGAWTRLIWLRIGTNSGLL